MEHSYLSGGAEGRVSTGPPSLQPHVLLNPSEVEAAVADLSRHDEFVIDVETTKAGPRANELMWVGLGQAAQVYLIPCGHPKGRRITAEHKEQEAACIHFPSDDPRSKTKLGKPSMRMVEFTVPATYAPPPQQLWPHEVCEIIRPLLWSERAKIGHNVKFDVMSLAKYYGHEIPPPPYHDTLVLQHVINEEETDYSLKALTCDWFGIPAKQRTAFYPNLGDKGIENFGLDEVARYLAKDLRYCWLRFIRWYQRLLNKGLEPVYSFEMLLYPVIMSMEYGGFPIDESKLGEVREELETRLAEITTRCHDLAGGEFLLSHTDSKRWVMFGIGKPAFSPTKRTLVSQRLKPLSFTPKEKLPQLTQSTLEYYADRNEVASLFLEWSVYEKLRGTFVEGLGSMLLRNGGELPTIHTSFKQHGTKTGRFSAEKPNPQQIPRGSRIRQLFVAGPGHVLIVADYDQIELRCLAYEARERKMIEIFKAGRDIHAEATAVAMEIALELVTAELRQVGKTLNFATGYGAGAERIAAVAGTSVRRGQKFLNRYYAEFSGLQPWKERVLAIARAAGDRANAANPPHVVIPPVGRLRRLPDLYRYLEDEQWMRFRAERQAINALIQGFAAYITKMAMLDMFPKLAEFSARMVLQVHDEIIVRVPERHVDDVMEVMADSMTGIKGPDGGPILGDVPLIVSAKAGYTWASAKG